MTIADRIKNRRIALGLTQEELAKRMGFAGKTSVSNIEAAGNEVSLKQVRKYAAALHCTEGYLLGMDENPSGPKQLSFFSEEDREKVDDEADKVRPAYRKRIIAENLGLLFDPKKQSDILQAFHFYTPEQAAEEIERAKAELQGTESIDDPDLPEENKPALTKRERLIQMILQMSDEQVDKIFEYSQFIQNKVAEC